MIWGAELSDLLTTSANISRAAYVQKHRKCELHACLIGRVPRHSSPAGMQNPKFCLSCVYCGIQISQLLLSYVHCVIQNAHFELKFKIRTLPSCENSLGWHEHTIWYKTNFYTHLIGSKIVYTTIPTQLNDAIQKSMNQFYNWFTK